MNNTDTPITDLFIRPRTKSFCQYTINRSNEPHAMKYDDMYQFLVKLVPNKTIELNKLVFGMKDFIVFVEQKEIIELTANLDINQVYKKMFNVKTAVKKQQINNKQKNKKSIFNRKLFNF